MSDYRDLMLTLHGLNEYNQAVDGEVFARNFSAFMHGLVNQTWKLTVVAAINS